MLDVVFGSRTEREVDEELKKLDPRLFLARQWSPRGEFYEVRFWEGSEREPTLIEDWRDGADRPKPLSSGLVYAVQEGMKRGPVDVGAIDRRNREIGERREDEAQELMERIAVEFQGKRRIGNYMSVPRSIGLRQSRDRIRRRGGKA